MTPEFPRAAEVTRDFAVAVTGKQYDGVISIDPVAMGYLMQGTDVGTVDGIDVTDGGLASVMLNGAYFTFESPADQDVFFEHAASALFAQVLDSGTGAIAPLERAIDEGRFMLWSSHPEEQALLGDVRIGGDFLVRQDAAGVFVNDGSGTKVGYYVSVDATAEVHQCSAEPTATLEVSLAHGFSGEVAGLPAYIGGLLDAQNRGQFSANVVVYPPAGWAVSSAVQDGAPVNLRSVDHGGRQATELWLSLEPSQQTVIQYTFSKLRTDAQWSVIAVTPGPNSAPENSGLVISDQSC